VDSLGLELTQMRRLHDVLAGALSPEVGGFVSFQNVGDRKQADWTLDIACADLPSGLAAGSSGAR
jgi:hypothetical protein